MKAVQFMSIALLEMNSLVNAAKVRNGNVIKSVRLKHACLFSDVSLRGFAPLWMRRSRSSC